MSWYAWYSIVGSSTTPIIAGFEKSTLLITEPCTSDFFEPQNSAVMASSRLNFMARQAHHIIP